MTRPSTRVAVRPAGTRPRKVVSVNPRLKAKARAQRQDRRSRRVRQALWVLACLLPLAGAVWLLVGSSVLAVQTVQVTGAHRLSSAQVLAAAGVAPGTPLAKVDLSAVEVRVAALAPVASVEVVRDWPHDLRVEIVERLPVVAIPRAHGMDLLDATGTTFATVASLPPGVHVLSRTTPAATRAALLVLKDLPPAIRSQLASIRAVSPEQITLLLRGGRQVLWGGANDNKTKAQALLVLLKMPGTVFDVSAPGVVTRR